MFLSPSYIKSINTFIDYLDCHSLAREFLFEEYLELKPLYRYVMEHPNDPNILDKMKLYDNILERMINKLDNEFLF